MEMEILSLACELIYGKINVCLQTAIMPRSVYIRSLFVLGFFRNGRHCHYTHVTSSLNNYVDQQLKL